MANVDTSGDNSGKRKIERVAKHEFLDVNGAVLGGDEGDDDLSDASVGYRYTVLESGQSAEFKIADFPDVAVRLFALFGMKTLAGHVSSQARQKKEPHNQLAWIQERFDLIAGKHGTPQWVDRSGGDRTMDLDKLTEAAVSVFVKAGKTVDAAKLRAKLDDAAYRSQIRQVKDIMTAYAELMGRTVVTVDDVFAALNP